MPAVLEETNGTEPEITANNFKIDYKTAAKDAPNRVQKEIFQHQLNAFEASEVEETKAPSSLSMIESDLRIDIRMVPEFSRIQSIILVAGHQVISNLSEPSEFTIMHLDIYADYLRQAEPLNELRAARAT